jgi:hypothetical protein
LTWLRLVLGWSASHSITKYFIILIFQLNQNHYLHNHTHIYSTINGHYHICIISHVILYMAL